MARHQYTQFRVGDGPDDDYTKAEIEALIYKVAEWFRNPKSGRNYEDPLDIATKRVQECLLGVNADGEPWKNCPKELRARLLSKCSYDMETGMGKPSLRNKSGGRNLKHGAEKAAKALNPAAAVAASFDDVGFRKKVEKDILAQFPELDNPAHLLNVRSISMLYAQRELLDMELAMGPTSAKRDNLLKSLKAVEEMLDDALKRLGIHPDQVKKRLNEKAAASVGDLVAAISDDKEYRQREKIWALQMALQLWWMTEHTNGNGTGPNMTYWECWHATRTRPIPYKCECGRSVVLVEGFEPWELKQYLLDNGVLKEELEVPVLPGLYDAEDLQGLADYKPEQSNDRTEAQEEEETTADETSDTDGERATTGAGIQDIGSGPDGENGNPDVQGGQ